MKESGILLVLIIFNVNRKQSKSINQLCQPGAHDPHDPSRQSKALKGNRWYSIGMYTSTVDIIVTTPLPLYFILYFIPL